MRILGTWWMSKPDAVTWTTTVVEPQPNFNAYLFMVNPTALSGFDPIMGINIVDFRITVSNVGSGCEFWDPDDTQIATISGGSLDITGCDYAIRRYPEGSYGNHVLLGRIRCFSLDQETEVTLKVGPRPGSGYDGPYVIDNEGDGFTCGTSVGGNPSTGYDDVTFIINPTVPVPVATDAKTWGTIKALYHSRP